MNRLVWIFTAALAVVLSACTQTAPTIETSSAQPPVISRFGASPSSGPAPLLVRFFWSISDANRDLMSCELDVSYDGNFTTDYSVGLPRTRTSNCTSSSRINHTFGVGNHNVALRVCDGLSCTIREQTIAVGPNPNNRPPILSNFAASPNPVQTGMTTTFSWSVSDPEGNPLTCTFDPNTVLSGNEQVVPCNQTYDHTYADSGNYTAQLSVTDGNSTINLQTLVQVFTVFSQIAGGESHTCALTTAGKAFCWGNNGNGQLGNGSNINANMPQAVSMPTGVTFSQIAAGLNHTCAIGNTGQVYCWGMNNFGQLGNSNNTDANTPQPISGPVSFSQIASGALHTCAISTTGNAYCWGMNLDGQLGNGNNTDANTPQAVTMPSSVTFSQISLGEIFSCAVATNGNAYCWGGNSLGQLGNGGNAAANTPQAVSMPSGVTFSQLAAGGYHSCALGSNNQAYCWGWNVHGQLGNGTSGVGTNASTPQPVSMPSGVTFSQLSSGYAYTCALGSNNQAYCWGYNLQGQLGNGNSGFGTNASTPQAVLAGQVPVSVILNRIAAGGNHSCALGNDNQAYCWGLNTSGQLGNNNNNTANTPQAVAMP